MLCQLAEQEIVDQVELVADVIHGDEAVDLGVLVELREVVFGDLQHLGRGEALGGVDHDHLVYDVGQLRGVPLRHRLVLTPSDVVEQIHQAHLLVLVPEGRSQLHKLVGDASQGPHICIQVIALVRQ